MTNDKTNKSVGLLGGSFDPVHNGHIQIAKSFLQSNYITELWILLTPDPPHKTQKALADFQYRLQMLEEAFSDVEGIKISDLENNLPKPSYTIQTLQYLDDEFPTYTFYLCLGEDSLQEFDQWKDWRQIVHYCDLLVATRPSTEKKQPRSFLKNKLHFINHDPVAISSTSIRNKVAAKQDISGLVPDSVYQIIKKNNLYQSAHG